MNDEYSSEIIIYQEEGQAVEVRLDARHDTVWLRQEQMSQLFGRARSVITKYLRNVFTEGELDADSVCAKIAHTAADGKTYQVEHYNLLLVPSLPCGNAYVKVRYELPRRTVGTRKR